MRIEKKLKIIEERNYKKFYQELFCVWLDIKRKRPGKMVCFWCIKIMEPKEFFENGGWFKTTRGGEIFERPTVGHSKINNLYLNTYNVELCDSCYFDLDIYNQTGLWLYP